jgi:predicted HicB family RNase H-like nuclease
MMANKRRESEQRKPPNRKITDQLNVRVPRELFRRVNIAAAGADKKLAAFVIEALDERTKDHKGDVQKIAEREKVSKKWQ